MKRNTKVLFIYTNINGYHSDLYHHGLAFIVAIANKNGFPCKVLLIKDISEISGLEAIVKSYLPTVVGFSSVSSQFQFVKRAAEVVKKASPDAITVVGGVHPTISPGSIKESSCIDGYFVGESELSFLEFLNKIENGEEYKGTDNYLYLSDGKIISNPLKSRDYNLDALPWGDKEVYPYYEIYKDSSSITFLFSRGCPYQCTYCSNHAIAGIYGQKSNTPRFRSAHLCIEEIEYTLAKFDFGDKTLWFIDDVFGMDKKWFYEFLELYKTRIKKPFICLLRVEMAREDMIKALKEAGCTILMFGIECGNEEFRSKHLKRKMSNKKIEEVFQLCRKYKIDTSIGNIIGFPGETEDMIRETIALNRKIKPTISGTSIFYPYKGTVLGDLCFAQGLVDIALFNDFSKERRESTLNFSKEYKKKLRDYAENWDFYVHPYNPRLYLEKYFSRPIKELLRIMHLLGLVRGAKKLIFSTLGLSRLNGG